jgi:hypothetical protein
MQPFVILESRVPAVDWAIQTHRAMAAVLKPRVGVRIVHPQLNLYKTLEGNISRPYHFKPLRSYWPTLQPQDPAKVGFIGGLVQASNKWTRGTKYA